jgi:hypothetical protein
MHVSCDHRIQHAEAYCQARATGQSSVVAETEGRFTELLEGAMRQDRGFWGDVFLHVFLKGPPFCARALAGCTGSVYK